MGWPGFVLAVEYCFNASFLTRCDGFKWFFSHCAATGRAHIFYDQGLFAGVFEAVNDLYFFSLRNSAFIKGGIQPLYRCNGCGIAGWRVCLNGNIAFCGFIFGRLAG